jgi:hypothetical protein
MSVANHPFREAGGLRRGRDEPGALLIDWCKQASLSIGFKARARAEGAGATGRSARALSLRPRQHLPGSAERERNGFHARVEKLDLELALGDGPRLSDQLVQPPFGHRAAAPVANVDPASSSRQSSVDQHTQPPGGTPLPVPG